MTVCSLLTLRRHMNVLFHSFVPFLSISHPFLGDYVRLRQNSQWRRCQQNDQFVVFADLINKVTRSGGKVSEGLSMNESFG
jgi:hypothetical protein